MSSRYTRYTTDDSRLTPQESDRLAKLMAAPYPLTKPERMRLTTLLRKRRVPLATVPRQPRES
jgi:hypothetical protein